MRCAIALTVGLMGNEISAIDALPTRHEVVDLLAGRERQVRAIHSRFQMTIVPRSADMEPRLQEIERRRGEAGTYQMPAGYVQANTYDVEWWGKGQKELWRKTPRRDQVAVLAFDGQIIRSLVSEGAQRFGRVSTPAVFGWNDAMEMSPYNIMYRYHSRPWSENVANSPKVDIAWRQSDGREEIEVIFAEHRPNETFEKLGFTLDREGRVRTRQYYGALSPKEPAIVLREFVLMGPYKVHKDAFGQSIWFPEYAERHYVAGITESGHPAVWNIERMAVNSIEFNSEVADAMFVPQLPSKWDVIDELSGARVRIPAEKAEGSWRGTVPSAEEKAGSSRGKWWWIMPIGCASVLLVYWLAAKAKKNTS